VPLPCTCSGLLLCSPENYTTNHKTNFQEVAFSQAMQCGSSGRNPDLARSLFVWDAERSTWCSHTYAATLLWSHFDRFWRRLVRCMLRIAIDSCSTRRCCCCCVDVVCLLLLGTVHYCCKLGGASDLCYCTVSLHTRHTLLRPSAHLMLFRLLLLMLLLVLLLLLQESDGVLLDAALDPNSQTRRGNVYKLANRE
jgi:hypothetical protein